MMPHNESSSSLSSAGAGAGAGAGEGSNVLAAAAGACEVTEIKGCYEDSNTNRLLPHCAVGPCSNPGKATTQEYTDAIIERL